MLNLRGIALAGYMASTVAATLAISPLPLLWWIVAALGLLGSNLILVAHLPAPATGKILGRPAAELDGEELAQVHQVLAADAPSALVSGRELADRLRLTLRDLDDVTVGRVTFEIARELQHQPDCCDGHAPYRVVDVLAAGLDLTALEWQSAGDLS